MNKLLIILAIFIINSNLKSQTFEGTLSYIVDLEVSQKMLDMTGVSRDELIASMKSEGTWADTVQTTYKNGFYKQLNLSSTKSWLIYSPESNNFFTFQEGENSDICTVRDASIDLEYKLTGKMPTVTTIDTLIKYKEFDLKMVAVTWKLGTYYYLYSENHFKADPENFKGHIYDGFYEYFKIAKALPIIIIKETVGMMTLKFSLIDYQNKQIDDSFFAIPAMKIDEELNGYNMGQGIIMRIKK